MSYISDKSTTLIGLALPIHVSRSTHSHPMGFGVTVNIEYRVCGVVYMAGGSVGRESYFADCVMRLL